ncbi:uncharacterized protein CLUP02_00783 [Colletotrichum lupini]|uniref:Uncharacterized protein n=1 Tax=Colletotrichum lupini TaxID=145971 RepID=A0A9Q8W9A5_9PEZI|nr:uncharacterized protein CLUP02_00783 [Colletotrichum lupini]UQC74135.1 hypothetical protein CLUP02_00783 [Colletotrichum lupini]
MSKVGRSSASGHRAMPLTLLWPRRCNPSTATQGRHGPPTIMPAGTWPVTVRSLGPEAPSSLGGSNFSTDMRVQIIIYGGTSGPWIKHTLRFGARRMELWRRRVPPRDPACSATTSPGLYHLEYHVGSCFAVRDCPPLRLAVSCHNRLRVLLLLIVYLYPLAVEISVTSCPFVRCHLLSHAWYPSSHDRAAILVRSALSHASVE